MPGIKSACATLVCLAFFALTSGIAPINATEQEAPSSASKRPNVLLIVAEDMSSRVGAFDDPIARTPAIDSLARQGSRYPNTFTVSGVCAPSRAALITGAQSISLGTQHMRTRSPRQIPGPINYDAVPPAEIKAFPELLRRAGYATANLAKTDYQFGEPFTIWDLHVPEAMPEDMALWRRLPKDKPFFVMLNMMATHETYLASPSDDGEDVPAFIEQVIKARAAMVEQVTNPDTVEVPPYLPDTPRVRASIAQHYDNIHFMDQQVGAVLDSLETDGLAGDTIVIWTTDHGDAFPRAKRAVYDSGIKVPLVIRYPDGQGQGSVDGRLVSFVDMAPTILTLAGVAVPDFIQGRDFLHGAPRQYIHAARDRMDSVADRVRAVRDDRFKYIRNHVPQEPYFRPLPFRDLFPAMQELWRGHKAGTLTAVQDFYFTAPRPGEELYDTWNDPHEIRNLVDDDNLLNNEEYSDVLTRLRAEMDLWLATAGDLGAMPEMDMIETMWPGMEQPVTAAPSTTVGTGPDVHRVSLDSATPGASIGYRLLPSKSVRESTVETDWNLYTGPLEFPAGKRLEAKAIRYGYRESPVTVIERH